MIVRSLLSLFAGAFLAPAAPLNASEPRPRARMATLAAVDGFESAPAAA